MLSGCGFVAFQTDLSAKVSAGIMLHHIPWKMLPCQEDTGQAQATSFLQMGVRPAFLRSARSTIQESRPGKPNQREGQNEKFMNVAHFFVNSGVFPWENKRDSHIELLFRNAPGKSS